MRVSLKIKRLGRRNVSAPEIWRSGKGRKESSAGVKALVRGKTGFKGHPQKLKKGFKKEEIGERRAVNAPDVWRSEKRRKESSAGVKALVKGKTGFEDIHRNLKKDSKRKRLEKDAP